MKNLSTLMKEMEAMQARMGEMEAKLERASLSGQSGGGLVKVTLNGRGAMTALAIDAGLLRPEEKDILEDLLIAAHGDARAKVEQAAAEEMKRLTGGLALPPGLKLPF